jgi:hypothetical protein
LAHRSELHGDTDENPLQTAIKSLRKQHDLKRIRSSSTVRVGQRIILFGDRTADSPAARVVWRFGGD